MSRETQTTTPLIFQLRLIKRTNHYLDARTRKLQTEYNDQGEFKKAEEVIKDALIMADIVRNRMSLAVEKGGNISPLNALRGHHDDLFIKICKINTMLMKHI